MDSQDFAPEATPAAAELASAKLKVFLSYSRKDGTFTRQLADALAARGYAPDYDQAATIPPISTLAFQRKTSGGSACNK